MTFSTLVEILRGRRLVVLTGAGCSTESGIPDYRGPDTKRETHRPILYQRFLREPAARRSYWARSGLGWRRVAEARPNPGHRALARMERAGLVRGIITQNVDGLHGAAGSHRVIELHGSLDRVRCLDCRAEEPRSRVQTRLLALNPGWARRAGRALERGEVEAAPDGDAEVGVASGFRVPACRRCGGVLKPDVVFFGENVPPARVEAAWRLFEEGEALLVAGSSLTVYSGFRFVERAAAEGRPVAIVNLGSTRGDEAATVRLEGRTGEILPRLAERLVGRPVSPSGGRPSRPADRRAAGS